MVGLHDGYNKLILRNTDGPESKKFSTWYFRDDKLLAVDAVNDMKAYMIGIKFIKNNTWVNKLKLANPEVELNPGNISSW